jgi:hypothetical protein
LVIHLLQSIPVRFLLLWTLVAVGFLEMEVFVGQQSVELGLSHWVTDNKPHDHQDLD